ncbi:MAG: HlyD family efflux transporter periplasmic adaptor subunit [Candidatus Omnitrophica bacterium]|nr:HlyD family efflux transporter periplasmic adaptor subunit [Candidatus Omnitrophota bacterium]
MRNKKLKITFGILILVSAVVIYQLKVKHTKSEEETAREIKPFIGSIYNIISTTGTVLPKNRLEVKPPVNGRIEEILVQEGQKVKVAETLAWMSSTERAALLDAARGRGEEDLKYWQETYKAIPLISPIDGEVIVATTQPGQTVTTADAVVVLSDHLIVRAQVDETDIGKIATDMKANITLDAYPDTKIKASVEHIYYESETVNNVTIYKVDLIPENVPPFFRSGMNASIDFIEQAKEGILLIPVEAAYKKNGESYVLLKQESGKNPSKRLVNLGITDDKNYEVLSGITASDTIIVTTKEYVFPGDNNNTGTNPFMPKMPGMKKNGSARK